MRVQKKVTGLLTSRLLNLKLRFLCIEKFIEALEENLGKVVQTGEFGADMKVSLLNDGPVTIIIDTKNKT